jgi:hypothetical protein
MRIWSLHPECLDANGLLGQWVEAITCRNMVQRMANLPDSASLSWQQMIEKYGNRQGWGYSNHPAFHRIYDHSEPWKVINSYMAELYFEATNRGANYNWGKIDWNAVADSSELPMLTVTEGQLRYEAAWLMTKLKQRDPKRYKRYLSEEFAIHPMFVMVNGGIETFERPKPITDEEILAAAGLVLAA